MKYENNKHPSRSLQYCVVLLETRLHSIKIRRDARRRFTWSIPSRANEVAEPTEGQTKRAARKKQDLQHKVVNVIGRCRPRRERDARTIITITTSTGSYRCSLLTLTFRYI